MLNLCGNRIRLLKAGALMALAVGITTPASAAEQTFTFLNLDQTTTVGLTGHGNATVGRYNGKLTLPTTKNVFLYCTDLTHNVGFGQQYSTLVNLGALDQAPPQTLKTVGTGTYYQDLLANGAGMASALVVSNDYLTTAVTNPVALQRASQVSLLVDSFLNASTGTPFTAALGTTGYTLAQYHGAVQVAVWEIIQDGYTASSTTWDTDGGFLTRSSATAFSNLGKLGSDADGESLVKKILDYSLTGTSYASTDNRWIQSERSLSNPDSHPQDFAFTDHAPIPEPAFYQMAGMLMMGGVAFARVRRKRS